MFKKNAVVFGGVWLFLMLGSIAPGNQCYAMQKAVDTFALLYDAVCDGNVNQVKRLLEHGIDPNQVNHYKCTVLHYAAARGKSEIVAALLAHGADPNMQGRMEMVDGLTPLHAAIQYWHIETISMLLQHEKTDPNIRDEYKKTPLHYAGRSSKIVQLLLNHPRIDPNIGDGCGYTPLHQAAEHNWVEVLCLLMLFSKTEIDASDTYFPSQTALDIAVAYRSIEAVTCLLQDPTIDPNHTDREGHTLLFADMHNPRKHYWQDLEIIRAGLRHPKIDPNVRDKECGKTSLGWAVFKHWYEVVDLLLTHPKINLNLRDREGWAPLHTAVWYCQSKEDINMIHALLEAGADPYLPTVKQSYQYASPARTPLMLAQEQLEQVTRWPCDWKQKIMQEVIALLGWYMSASENLY